VRELTQTLTIAAPAPSVLEAFFDADALAVWWQARRSLCTPRMLGCYAIEWMSPGSRDELLGPLGGVFHGTIVDFAAGREVLVADAYWLPVIGDPIGPMALEIRCFGGEHGTVLSLRQSGWDNTPRWNRYYEILGRSLPAALAELKRYLEQLHSTAGPGTAM
jgi:uncharacterized protein YndB with AHSA1/START domain